MGVRSRFLSQVEAFCDENGLSESAFGQRAVGDPKFVGRLRSGKGLIAIERAEVFMAARTPRKSADG